MTRLFLDTEEISMPTHSGLSWQKLLHHVENTYLPAHTAIRRINVDGRPLYVEDLMRDSERIPGAIDQMNTIEIFTATVREIGLEAIREAIGYLERVENAVPLLATSFRGEPGPGAFDSLRHLYEGFYWVNLLLDRLNSSFQYCLDGLSIEGRGAYEHYLRLSSVLKLLIESQQRNDNSATADLLEHGISAIISECQVLFSEVCSRIESAPAGTLEGRENDNLHVNPLTPGPDDPEPKDDLALPGVIQNR